MRNRYRYILAFCLIIIDLSLAFLSVYLFLSPTDKIEMWLSWYSFQNGLYISMQTWMIASIYHRIYRIFSLKGFEGLYQKSWRVLLTQQVFYLVYLKLNPFILKNDELLHHALFSFSFLVCGVLITRILITVIGRRMERNLGLKYSVAIWGFNQTGIELAAQFEMHPEDRKFFGILDENQSFDYTKKKELKIKLVEAIKLAAVKKIHELYICIAPQALNDLSSVFKIADENCIRIRFVPDVVGNYPDNAIIHTVHRFQAISQRMEPLEDQNNRFVKRIFDVLFSLLVIIFVMSWLYPIIGLLIKLQSKGPIIFKQLRSGENNEPFLCYKFRSMKLNDESDSKQAVKGDSRVTKIGEFIRKTSLDELPQFFNVLKGEMSVVGPRPHMLNHTKQYNQLTENFMVRHFVKPGITGLAQIRGLRGEITDMKYIQDRINMDIEYLENWNLISDIKICFLTFYYVLKGDEHAY
jgi:Undecaprenyl-phosphate glucose phosphotransferase